MATTHINARQIRVTDGDSFVFSNNTREHPAGATSTNLHVDAKLQNDYSNAARTNRPSNDCDLVGLGDDEILRDDTEHDNMGCGDNADAFIFAKPCAPATLSRETSQHCTGLTAGTLVETTNGMTPVQDIRKGDLLRTYDNGFQPVIWVGQQRVDLMRPPVGLRPGVFGNTDDLLLAPHHAVLLGQHLVRAYHFANSTAQQPDHYVHLLLATHELIHAGGAWAETFYPSTMNLSALEPQVCSDLAGVLPQLAKVVDLASNGETARAALIANYGKPIRPYARPSGAATSGRDRRRVLIRATRSIRAA